MARILDPLSVGDDASRLLQAVSGDDDVGAAILDPLGVSGDDDVGYFDVGDDDVGAMTLAEVQSLATNPKALLAKVNHLQNMQRAKKAQRRQLNLGRQIGVVAQTKNMPTSYLGIPVTAVPAGGTVTIQATPTSPVRITNLSVQGAIAELFLINSITISRLSLFLSANSIPADRFLPTSVRPPMETPIVHASIPVVLSVTNISGAAANFAGAFDVIDLSTQVN